MKTIHDRSCNGAHWLWVSNVPGLLDTRPIAAALARGARGVVSAELCTRESDVLELVGSLARQTGRPFALQLGHESPATPSVLSALPDQVDTVIFSPGLTKPRRWQIPEVPSSVQVWASVTSVYQALEAVEQGAQGLIAKGHEAAGLVEESTSYILLQALLDRVRVPIVVQGGIGPNAAAACWVAGAAGVWLDEQLLLARESSLSPRGRSVVAALASSDTPTIGPEGGPRVRCRIRRGNPEHHRIAQLAAAPVSTRSRQRWLGQVARLVGWRDPTQEIWLLGEAAVLAAPLARRYSGVGGIVDAYVKALDTTNRLLNDRFPLAANAPLARDNGTVLPILQGPMTRVSDRPAFTRAVAEAGGLPFVALGKGRHKEVTELLADTRAALGDLPWGVGMLGFLEPELYSAQLQALVNSGATFILLAGAKPQQANDLERQGFKTYVHVPSPELVALFVDSGITRFIFEGRECGGHVGPDSSFMLWQRCVDALLDTLKAAKSGRTLHAVFAGGIHDARSATMVAALAAPLIEQGVHVGILMGTAYLFTREATQTGAIVQRFQEVARRCRQTALLTSGPGHSTRCADTAFVQTFRNERQRLSEENVPEARMQQQLEQLNLGRLRSASKGVVRERTDDANLIAIDEDDQERTGLYMMGQVATLRDTIISLPELHETVTAGSAAFWDRHSSISTPPSAATPDPCDVAIVGMQCVLPGATGLEEFWLNILDARDCVGEVPNTRFDIERYFSQDGGLDRTRSRWGGFISGTDFDPLRYKIPPSALRSIDPIQLLTLAVADAALCDAGYDERPFDRSRTSVILGVGGGLGERGFEFAFRAMLPEFITPVPEQLLEQLPDWDDEVFSGVLLNVTAGRIANRLDLGGVNFTTDAACASSLAALYAGIRELRAGTSDMVLVGGAETLQSPFGYLCFSSVDALSPRGRCRTFDESADGVVISEGVGVVVLKRLQDAQRDGDRIYGVVKGIAGSSDGKAKALVAPSPEGQVRALVRSYALAGVEPGSVSLVEAHGTGTVAGDAAELRALRSVYQEATPRSCVVGSVKSMIGHTKAAAGIAGLIKATLALHHRVLPPTRHVDRPNAELLQALSPFYTLDKPIPWPQMAGIPRRAAVSAFGFGGTNFHAVLEEAPQPDTVPGSIAWPAELLVFEALARQELASKIERAQQALAQGEPLRDVARRCAVECSVYGHQTLRAAFVVGSAEEAISQLELAAASLHSERSSHPNVAQTPNRAPCLAFLYPGQGSQKLNMLRELAVYFPDFCAALSRADTLLQAHVERPLSSYVYPGQSGGTNEESRNALTDTRVAQPALGAIEMGATLLLRRLGLSPSVAAGHSYGEYVALWAAGTLTDDQLLQLSALRGAATHRAVQNISGGMLAVRASADDTTRALAGLSSVFLANLNSPKQTVIAGDRTSLQQARLRLEATGLTCVDLPVSCPFHTPLLASAEKDLATILLEQPLAPPNVPVFSNGTASPYPAEKHGIRSLLQQHVTQPVRFSDQIEAMVKHGANLFVEVGPGSVLTRLVDECLTEAHGSVTRLALDAKPGLRGFLSFLADLWLAGAALDCSELFRARPIPRSPLHNPQAEWCVDGGQVYRRGDSPLTRQPVTLAGMSKGETTPEDDTDHVMARHHEVMQQLLRSHEAVMLAYLNGSAPATLDLGQPTTVPSDAATATVAPKPTTERPLPVAPQSLQLATAEQLGALLIRIVSEKTGYPHELITLQSGLEDDLGINSLRRLEVLATLRASLPEAQRKHLQPHMDELGRCPTLADIVSRTSEVLFSEKGTADKDRFELVAKAVVPVSVPQVALPKGVAVLTTDSHGIAEQIAAELVVRGHVIVVLQHEPNGPTVRRTGRRCPAWRIDLTNEAEISRALTQIRAEHGPIASLVHGLALDTHAPESPTDLTEKAPEVLSLLLLLQATRDELVAAQGVLAALTGRGGQFGLDSTPSAPVQEGLAAFVRSVARELPEVRTRVLDLDIAQSSSLNGAELVDELWNSNPSFAEHGLSHGGTWQRCAQLAPSSPTRSNFARSRGVYLLTGGARGVTAELAVALARVGRPHLVLVGSTALPNDPGDLGERNGNPTYSDAGNNDTTPDALARYRLEQRQEDIRSTLHKLKSLGATVEYHATDVRDDIAVARLLQQVYATHGKIDGAVHGAGVIEDRSFMNKKPESMHRVFAPKLEGAKHIVANLDWDKLRFFVFMSSVSASFGNAGQSDYAAANGILDGMARELGRFYPHVCIRSIAWGPWAGVGMADNTVLDTLKQRGLEPITVERGAAAFLEELDQSMRPGSTLVLGRGPWCTEIT